jgi:ADP-ribose pyrophosphatase YjhB (NUDIX family)
MIWTPHVTVATVVKENGRFLLVEEVVDGRRCFNQPAGHWDPGLSLIHI